MNYHLSITLITSKETISEMNIESRNMIVDSYLIPLFSGHSIFLQGKLCSIENISSLLIKESQDPSQECVNIFKGDEKLCENDEYNCIFKSNKFAIDITKEILNENENIQLFKKSIFWFNDFFEKSKKIIIYLKSFFYKLTLFLISIPLFLYIVFLIWVFTKYSWPTNAGISAICGLTPPIIVFIINIFSDKRISIPSIKSKVKSFWDKRINNLFGYNEQHSNEFKELFKWNMRENNT